MDHLAEITSQELANRMAIQLYPRKARAIQTPVRVDMDVVAA